MSAHRSEGASRSVQEFRWPWGNTYQGKYENVTRTVKDRITGQETEVLHKDYTMTAVDYDQMQADERWKKILGPIIGLAILATLLVGGMYLGRYINKP